jgi:site-specific DNA-cytosine methylase
LSARDFKGVGNQYVQEHKLVVESSNPIYVRRLTPTECERLMGWPDNHTLHRADGKVNSDSTRYKMCGNGVASPVIKWVIEKIKNI